MVNLDPEADLVRARSANASVRRKGRPRSQKVHQAILQAALELVQEVGFSNLTIEGIATQAGTSKLTIYRRWPTKAAIVMEAFLDQASSKLPLPFPDTGSVVDEFRRQMRACVKLLTGPYGKLLSTLLGGIQIDGQLAEAFRLRWLEPRRREAKEVLQRGIDRGELAPGIDQEALIDALYGPLYFRLLFGHQRLTTKLSDRVVEMVLLRCDPPLPCHPDLTISRSREKLARRGIYKNKS